MIKKIFMAFLMMYASSGVVMAQSAEQEKEVKYKKGYFELGYSATSFNEAKASGCYGISWTMLGANTTMVASMPSFRLWHFSCLLVRTIAWHHWHSEVVNFCLAHDVSTELQERLLIIGIWTTFAIFPYDTVLGYGSYSSNHTESHFCGHVLQLQ